MSEFQKWWDETYGQILTITNDLDADASCRIAKIAAMDAWKAGIDALEEEREALRNDAERWKWAKQQGSIQDAIDSLVGDTVTISEMEAAIDAAMAAKESQS